MSARTGGGLKQWFAGIRAAGYDTRSARACCCDHYAEGEALLGWFNGTFHLAASTQFDGNKFLQELALELSSRLAPEHPEVAHFKAVPTPDDDADDIAVLNLVGS